MEIVEVVERLGSFGLLAALIWYMASRMLPRTIDMFRQGLDENTKAVNVGLDKATAAVNACIEATHEGRRENAAAHEKLAAILDRMDAGIASHSSIEEARMARLVELLERLIDRQTADRTP